jgi:hypothetical protein
MRVTAPLVLIGNLARLRSQYPLLVTSNLYERAGITRVAEWYLLGIVFSGHFGSECVSASRWREIGFMHHVDRGLWAVDEAKINQEMEVKDEELLLFEVCEA